MHRPNKILVFILLSGLLLITSAASMMTGALDISFQEIISILLQSNSEQSENGIPLATHITITDIRLPRLLLAILVGSSLAISGAATQGLFRNPLADPGLIGVSSGAAFGAVTIIVLGDTWLKDWQLITGRWALPIAAFLCGLSVTFLIYRIATRHGNTQVATLLLAGIAINAIAGAGTGLLTYVADDTQLRSLTFWSMGSLAKANWNDLWVVMPFIVIPVILIPFFATALNSFLMGEAIASHLGFRVRWIKFSIIFLTAMAVGSAVAMSGVIGFLGLVVPHLLRQIVGPDHRILLPASALAGALLLTLADMLARTVVAPAELPIGLLMALIGGPFFLSLLLRRSMSFQRYA